jgi:hypothetical protein
MNSRYTYFIITYHSDRATGPLYLTCLCRNILSWRIMKEIGKAYNYYIPVSPCDTALKVDLGFK